MKKFPLGPLRTCLGCGRKKVKQNLIRLVHNGQGEIIIDSTQKMAGRGTYWCGSKECAERLKKKKKKLAWALRQPGITLNCNSW